MKKGKTIFLAATSLLLTGCANEVIDNPEEEVTYTEGTYSNFIIRSDCPDPSVVRDGNTLYIYGTGGLVYRSRNAGQSWSQLSTIQRSISWGASPTAIWAPDVYKIGDQWLYYYSNSVWGGEDTAGIGVMVSDSLEGPWTDLGKIFDSEEIGVMNSIDPNVVQDDDGTVWMVWGSFRGLYMIELTDDGTALKNPETASEDKIWIAGNDGGSWDGTTFEGSYIRKIGDYWYYFGSQGTCCDGVNSTYKVRVGRSTSITGPYYDADGNDLRGQNVGSIVVQSDQNIAGPGHNSLFEDDEGEWWIVYHGYEMSSGNGRYVLMDKLIWTDDGWPYLRSYKPTYEKEQDCPKFITTDEE